MSKKAKSRKVRSKTSIKRHKSAQLSLSSMTPREQGFTLIEVMVALAILAVVAVAASRASSAYLNSVDVLKTRTLAQFVAQNAAADLQIQDIWLTSNRVQTANEQGRDWQVTTTLADTLSPALKQVNISVAPIIEGQVRSAVTDLTLVLSDTSQEAGSLDLSRIAQQGKQ